MLTVCAVGVAMDPVDAAVDARRHLRSVLRPRRNQPDRDLARKEMAGVLDVSLAH